MEASLLALLQGFIVYGLTALIKKIPAMSNMSDSVHTALMRFLVAILSFISTVVTSKISGMDIEQNTINTFAQAAIVFLSATGTFFLTKTKDPGTEIIEDIQ